MVGRYPDLRLLCECEFAKPAGERVNQRIGTLNTMRFQVLGRYEDGDEVKRETLVTLRRDAWDDWGFRTLFHIQVHRKEGDTLDLGEVKILQRSQGKGSTSFEANRFRSLTVDYCSLGQDISYYEKLKQLDIKEREFFLSAMRDAATHPEIATEFSQYEGWKTSLLRFGQAQFALSAASDKLIGISPTEGVASFDHRSDRLDSLIRFDFDDSTILPGRSKVLIGYNGVGKTQLLAEIASVTSRVGLANGPVVEVSASSATFSAVIAVSYSAFDTFTVPIGRSTGSELDPVAAGSSSESSVTAFGYTYCGLRRLEDGRASTKLKSIDEVNAELAAALSVALGRDRNALVEAFRELDNDPSFGRAGIKLETWAGPNSLFTEESPILSAGQKIVVNIVVQLAAQLRTRALVLIDEPETHLHPPLLAALLRAIQRLLDRFDAFSIIATHSPVVLQEVPSKDVIVLQRFGTKLQSSEATLETFGANIGELTREAFGLDNTVADYRFLIRELASRLDVDQIEDLFPKGLSSQARALVLRARREVE